MSQKKTPESIIITAPDFFIKITNFERVLLETNVMFCKN